MRHCQGCGGILGRDCFNEQECIWISQGMEQDGQQALQANYELHNEIAIRDQHIAVLQDAVKEFLKVINRTPTALEHYGSAIMLAEAAILKAVQP